MIGPAPLTLQVVDVGDHLIVRLVGELDLTSAPALDECLQQLTDSGSGSVRLLLDVSGLAFCDSSGISRFISAAQRCGNSGGWLRLAAPQPQLLRVLAIAGLLAALATYSDLAAAQAGDEDTRLLVPPIH
jgi:anti-sigma B factor antagonist